MMGRKRGKLFKVLAEFWEARTDADLSNLEPAVAFPSWPIPF